MLAVGARAPEAVFRDKDAQPVTLPPAGTAALFVFYRGDWCPWCNGQLASLGRRLEAALPPGQVFGVSADPPERVGAMRARLRLPFRLLSDEGGEAIARFGAWSEEERLARPAAVVVDGAGIVRHSVLGIGFAERADVDELLEALRSCA